MQNELKTLIQEVQNGNEAALTLHPRTLWLILKELEGMCVSTDEIECKPVNNDRPGFWMKLKGGGTLIYYVQNGALKAGYFNVIDEPLAPGL